MITQVSPNSVLDLFEMLAYVRHIHDSCSELMADGGRGCDSSLHSESSGQHSSPRIESVSDIASFFRIMPENSSDKRSEVEKSPVSPR